MQIEVRKENERLEQRREEARRTRWSRERDAERIAVNPTHAKHAGKDEKEQRKQR